MCYDGTEKVKQVPRTPAEVLDDALVTANIGALSSFPDAGAALYALLQYERGVEQYFTAEIMINKFLALLGRYHQTHGDTHNHFLLAMREVAEWSKDIGALTEVLVAGRGGLNGDGR